MKADDISSILSVCAAHSATIFKVSMRSTRKYSVVGWGEEAWFLSSYLRSQHNHQRQSRDICVDAIVPPIQRDDVAVVDNMHLREVTVLQCCASPMQAEPPRLSMSRSV